MLKTGCVFALEEIEEFYKSCGENAMLANDAMFFYLAEDGEYFGMIRMCMQGDTCFLQDIVCKAPNILYEEFLLKSCVNFALTFAAKKIATTKKYAQFLIAMHFEKQGENLVGDVEKIDFPHPCCDGKK